MNEFSRIVDCGRLGDGIRHLEANAEERVLLAKRFLLVAVNSLRAKVALSTDGSVVTAEGHMDADIVQSCAVSGEDLPFLVSGKLKFRFVPESEHRPDEEVELREEDCDDIEFAGTSFDLGEAVAQSLALAIDPFATGPDADKARQETGVFSEGASGPFAALSALKKQ